MKKFALALATIAALGFAAPAFAGGEPAKRTQTTQQTGKAKKAAKKTTTKRTVGSNVHAGSQRRPVRKGATKTRSSLNLKSTDANAFVAGYEPRRKAAKRASVAKRIKNVKAISRAKRAAKTALSKASAAAKKTAKHIKGNRKTVRHG